MYKYKYDMHVHTERSSSCGSVKAERAVVMYKKAGYDGLVITDHYYRNFFERLGKRPWEEKIDIFLSGFRAARSAGKENDLNVLPGIELRFTQSGSNEYLIYGIDEGFLKKNPRLYTLDLRSFAELISGREMLIIQAHPFRPGMTRADPNLLDGVEVFNGNMRHDSQNSCAHIFARKYNLLGISGSDFHEVEDLGQGGILLNKNPSTTRELVASLASRSYTTLRKGESPQDVS